jgi:hypothetical protein
VCELARESVSEARVKGFSVGEREKSRKLFSAFPENTNKEEKKLNTDTTQAILCIAAVRALCLPVLVHSGILNFDIQ